MLATAAPVNTGQTATPSLKVLPDTVMVLPVRVVGEAAQSAYSPLQIAMVWAWALNVSKRSTSSFFMGLP